MKVLVKSLEELELEYGIEKFEDHYIVSKGIIYPDMLNNLLGKIVEATYDKKSDSYVVDGWYLHPNFIKGEVIGYTIKRLSDGKKCTFSF